MTHGPDKNYKVKVHTIAGNSIKKPLNPAAFFTLYLGRTAKPEF